MTMTRKQFEKEKRLIEQKMEELRNDIQNLQDEFENDDFFDYLAEAKYGLDNAGQEFYKAMNIYEDGGLDNELG